MSDSGELAAMTDRQLLEHMYADLSTRLDALGRKADAAHALAHASHVQGSALVRDQMAIRRDMGDIRRNIGKLNFWLQVKEPRAADPDEPASVVARIPR